MALYDLIYDTYKTNSSKSSCEFLVVDINFSSQTVLFDGNTYKFSETFICASLYNYGDVKFKAIAFRLGDEILVLDKLI